MRRASDIVSRAALVARRRGSVLRSHLGEARTARAQLRRRGVNVKRVRRDAAQPSRRTRSLAPPRAPLELHELPPALRAHCALLPCVEGPLTADVYNAVALRFSGSAAAGTPPRASTRLVVTPLVGCGQKWMALRARSEALHHALASAGQDLAGPERSARCARVRAAPSDARRPRLAGVRRDAAHGGVQGARCRRDHNGAGGHRADRGDGRERRPCQRLGPIGAHHCRGARAAEDGDAAPQPRSRV